MIDLSGKTALVTGGSRGIGRAVAVLLAKAGANLSIGYQLDAQAAHDVSAEIRKAGQPVIAVPGDISRRSDVERLFRQSREAFGAVHIVVANAGIWRRAPIGEMTDDEWLETIDTNLKSAFLVCQQAIPEMRRNGKGCIILMSSTAGQRGEPYYSHYAASKGALIAMTKSLATEVAGTNIRINCVAPGWVVTDMTRDAFQDPDFRKSVVETIPLRRIASPEDIAGVVLFLASHLSRHVHGEVINVNGGSVLCG
jgi:3-oxoacyl-[acyl-carrier protein] reductase